jgi:hypothetical protein
MLSRNLSAKRSLSREFTQRYKRVASNSTGVSKTQFIREQYSNNKNTNQIPLSDKQIKQQIIENFDNKKIDELKKRQKFAPFDETIQQDIVEEPIIDICDLVDTGFEDDCDYYGNLFLLGDYIILENFETRSNDDIGGEIFDVSKFKYIEDFEDNEVLGEVWNMTQNPPVEGNIVNDEDILTPVTNFNASKNIDQNRIELSWTVGNNPNGYVLEKSVDNVNWIPLGVFPPTLSSYNDTDVVLDTTYYYRIDNYYGTIYSGYNYEQTLILYSVYDSLITQHSIDTSTNINDLAAVENLITYIRSQGLLDNFIIYPMKSNLNYSSGSTFAGIGGLPTNGGATIASTTNRGADGFTGEVHINYDFYDVSDMIVWNSKKVDFNPAPNVVPGLTFAYGWSLDDKSIYFNSTTGFITGERGGFLSKNGGSNYKRLMTSDDFWSANTRFLETIQFSSIPENNKMWVDSTIINLNLNYGGQAGYAPSVLNDSMGTKPYSYISWGDGERSVWACYIGTLTDTQRETIDSLIQQI